MAPAAAGMARYTGQECAGGRRHGGCDKVTKTDQFDIGIVVTGGDRADSSLQGAAHPSFHDLSGAHDLILMWVQ